jgi:hypothetical protein
MKNHRTSWSPQHHVEWKSSLERLAYPKIGKLDVASIDTGLVMRILEPIWEDKRVTASRVRGRLECILGWATTSGFRTGPEPYVNLSIHTAPIVRPLP